MPHTAHSFKCLNFSCGIRTPVLASWRCLPKRSQTGRGLKQQRAFSQASKNLKCWCWQSLAPRAPGRTPPCGFQLLVALGLPCPWPPALSLCLFPRSPFCVSVWLLLPVSSRDPGPGDLQRPLCQTRSQPGTLGSRQSTQPGTEAVQVSHVCLWSSGARVSPGSLENSAAFRGPGVWSAGAARVPGKVCATPRLRVSLLGLTPSSALAVGVIKASSSFP